MAAVLDLRKLVGPSVQKKKWKFHFQDRHHGSHLGFQIETTVAFFDLQVTQMIPSKFQVNLLFGSEEEAKNRFSRCLPASGHFGTILALFDIQITPMLPTEFQVNWPFDSWEGAKNIFSRWTPRRPSWISDRNDFSYFWSTSYPDASYQVSSQLAFCFRRRSEKYIFKMATAAVNLDFRSESF